MKYGLLLIVFIMFSSATIGQQINGYQLLDRAITYHDPNSNWDTFSGTLNVTMETPNNPDRLSKISINLLEDFFNLEVVKKDKKTNYTLDKGSCRTSIIDSINDSSKRTPCETAVLYKNYYTYLYGLPMKLKDPGTIINPKVGSKNFKGKDYLVLQVTYEETVGKDVWFFYFDPVSYAMEVYQFFKGDPMKEGENTGEYILLTEETVINGIKMPKNRAWYYNKDDTFLGVDILTQ